MSAPPIPPPQPGEYDSYYQTYLDGLPAGDVIALLDAQRKETQALLSGLTEREGRFRYDVGKWSIKEVVGHLVDVERVLAYRALRFSRADTTPLPGFEQDDYVSRGNFDSRSLADLLAELDVVRSGTLALYRGMSAVMLARQGTANEATMSVCAVPWIILGHERHHLDILRERYLAASEPGERGDGW
jgi:hypothetical protein